jgi:Holliday junction resolvasome RuvABC ATP-dependent DNA helicase subunit
MRGVLAAILSSLTEGEILFLDESIAFLAPLKNFCI